MLKILACVLISFLLPAAYAGERPGNLADDFNPGALHVLQLGGEKPDQTLELPLEHTEVHIEVSGFVAQAVVTQRFHNPFQKPIEAVYTFPLPEDAAVDDMHMQVGERIIKGVIKRREEARWLYEKARREGKRAALLEQERPNIFTQSVANILPGEQITVSLRYVNILKYENNAYELVFPMVVGPRYIPGTVVTGKEGSGTVSDTDVVPDASRITPPVLKPGERSGHDISLTVKLDAGVAVQKLYSPSHRLGIESSSAATREVRLYPADSIPNKDFILRYHTAGDAPAMALLAHHDERGGFFTLLIQPQATVSDTQTVARELIFILDTSGSMSGAPLAQSKQAMRRLLGGMRQGDTFNVVRFAGDSGTLWEKPRPYNTANAEAAWQYVEGLRGSGGTEMRKGVIDALARPAAADALRIAFLLTDGYVGNEVQILQAIEKERRGARVFALGVSSSPNRYLLNRVAEAGRGETFYLRHDAPDAETAAVMAKFFQRVDRPALAYLDINWGGLEVEQLYPAKLPDVFAGQPLRIHGRYRQGGSADIVLSGQAGAKPYQQTLSVTLPQNAPEHAAMANVWARQKVRELMARMVREGQSQELIDAVTQTGLEFRLMTQWTSFVAVEETVVNKDGKPQTVVQPVELPEGVSYEGVFGEGAEKKQVTKLSPIDLMYGPSSCKDGYAPPAPPPGYKGNTRGLARGHVPPPPAASAMPEFPTDQIHLYRGADKRNPFAPPASMQKPAGEDETDDAQVLQITVYFAQGDVTLTEAIKEALDQFINGQCGKITRLRITGYTDRSHSDEDFNLTLSRKRAEAVKKYLLGRCPALAGIDIIVAGKGSEGASPGSETERAGYRRVEVEVL